MKVGCSRHLLTPFKDEFYLIGFRSDNRYEPASGVHDDIYCNSLVLDKDGKQIFMFSADFLEFEESMAEDVKTLMLDKYGLERDNVLLIATHDHSSTVAYHKGWYTGKFDQDYYDFLIETICKSYEECVEDLREATAKCGKKEILGYYGNRNHPGEKADNEVIVIKFYDESGAAFAGIVNWAVHSTVLNGDNTWLSADWAGNVCNLLYNDFGFYPLMMVGAAGDCSNRNERQGQDFDELARVSEGMEKEIAAIKTDKELNLDKLMVQTLFHTIHTDTFHLDAKGWVINLGGLQIFVFPGELGSAFGLQIKAACPVQALISGYTNGYYEYFLPASEYGLSFETADSPVPRGEPEKLIQKYIQVSKIINK